MYDTFVDLVKPGALRVATIRFLGARAKVKEGHPKTIYKKIVFLFLNRKS